MAFKKTGLESQVIWLVEVWSYKIKVCVCEFKNDRVEILAYSEKRQSTSYFVNGECKNLEMLGTSIKDAIRKTEKDHEIIIKDIILNFPFGELFFYGNKLNYKRENEKFPLSKPELEKILGKTQKLMIDKSFKNIEKKTGFTEEDLKLMLSSIVDIKIDKTHVAKVVGSIWRDISISLVNIFIPNNKSSIIKYLWEIIERKIKKIVPTEFALRNLCREDDIVIVHIGAIYTSVTIKKGGKISGISKIAIGLSDLVTMISKHHKETHAKILKKIHSWSYENQEKIFLEIWKEGLVVGIQDIIGTKILPKNIFVLSDASEELFKEAISNIEFKKKELKLVKKLNFVEVKEKFISKEISNYDDFKEEINLEIYAMILEMKNIIKNEKRILIKSLKKAVYDLWYSD